MNFLSSYIEYFRSRADLNNLEILFRKAKQFWEFQKYINEKQIMFHLIFNGQVLMRKQENPLSINHSINSHFIKFNQITYQIMMELNLG